MKLKIRKYGYLWLFPHQRSIILVRYMVMERYSFQWLKSKMLLNGGWYWVQRFRLYILAANVCIMLICDMCRFDGQPREGRALMKSVQSLRTKLICIQNVQLAKTPCFDEQQLARNRVDMICSCIESWTWLDVERAIGWRLDAGLPKPPTEC